uniref:BTB domain-containing protein n=1 Tax=Panagrolaimus sp. ES5 TaxID=591445 RepID=A0AC34GCR2_9BILA
MENVMKRRSVFDKSLENVVKKKMKFEEEAADNELPLDAPRVVKAEPRSRTIDIFSSSANSSSSSSNSSLSTENDPKWYKMLTDDRYFDVILVSKPENLNHKSHRCILAKYSETFVEMFKKLKKLPVKINTEFDAATVKAALAFMLDKSYPAGNEIDIFKFAAKYGIQELMDFHYSIVEKQIDAGNVCDLIQIAYDYKNEELKQRCFKVMSQNKKKEDLENLPRNILLDFILYSPPH